MSIVKSTGVSVHMQPIVDESRPGTQSWYAFQKDVWSYFGYEVYAVNN
jgi:hypothetical protein